MFSLIFVWIVFLYIIFMSPDWLGHSDNYNIANGLVTPSHMFLNGTSYHCMQFYARYW